MALAAAWFAGALILPAAVRADGAAAVQAMQKARAAAEHMAARDPAAAVDQLEAAVSLRPDFPQLHLDLAAARLAAGQDASALDALGQYAAFGLFSPVERAAEFAALRARSDFQAIVKRIAAHQQARGTGEVVFSLREVTGLIEAIAWRQGTGQFLFGDVNARTIWVREAAGTLRRLVADEEALWGVFGLAVDEAAGVVWAATSAVPEMRGFTPDLAGQAALAEIELDSGSVRRVLPVPRPAGSEAPHRLTDLALGDDGTVWVLDGGMPILWRLRPGGANLERAVESDEFFALQGLAVLPSGTLLLSDQVNGLVQVDPVRGQARWLPPPADTTLGDLHSLTVAPDGRVLALQSGVRPNRVLALELEAEGTAIARVEVIEAGHIAMGAPSQGCLGADGDYYFIGFAGWSRFAAGDGAPTAPRLLPIFRTKLPKPRKQ